MSQNKNIVNEIIEYIETAIQKGFDEVSFIKKFREKIENFLEEDLL